MLGAVQKYDQMLVAILEHGNGSPTESDYEAANTFFTSVFTNESLSDIPSLPDRSNRKELNNITIIKTSSTN